MYTASAALKLFNRVNSFQVAMTKILMQRKAGFPD
jgi:hypothetical protein